jgi:hypothetical protein
MQQLQPKNFTASATLTRSDAFATLTLSAAAGLTLTLPASAGLGDVYRFFVQTTVTSNSVIIKVANATDVMAGIVLSGADGGSTVNGWETAASSDTITLDGSTTGGIRGDWIEVQDVATGFWRVTGWTSSTGTEATPFSATVS